MAKPRDESSYGRGHDDGLTPLDPLDPMSTDSVDALVDTLKPRPNIIPLTALY